jgi:hypothetical protein
MHSPLQVLAVVILIDCRGDIGDSLAPKRMALVDCLYPGVICVE